MAFNHHMAPTIRKPTRGARALTMHTRSFLFDYACESCTVSRRATLRRRARDFSLSKHNRPGIRHHATRAGSVLNSRVGEMRSLRAHLACVHTYARMGDTLPRVYIYTYVAYTYTPESYVGGFYEGFGMYRVSRSIIWST